MIMYNLFSGLYSLSMMSDIVLGAGLFSMSCESVEITDSRYLRAKCDDGSGTLVPTELDLGRCYENNDGNIRLKKK